MNEPKQTYSLVIPAYNCKNSLIRLLECIRKQTYPKELFEILVVNDGSDDGTEKIGELYPEVKMVHHETNRGRVQARETGANSAQHDTLVYLDARLTIESDLLENAAKLDYLPLMGVGASDKTRSMIDRIFYLIRRRVYWPFEPQSKYHKELWLKPGEFDGRPKGTGLLIIDRSMFLESALEEKGQDVNDDTKLLYRIVHEKAPILRHTDLTFFYEHRHKWKPLLKHTFFRGPKFFDYYLAKGGPLRLPYLAGCLIVAAYIGGCFVWPLMGLILPVILLLIWLGSAIYMSEGLVDIFVCMTFFPPIAIAFISGIMFAQFARLFGVRHWIKH